MRIKPSIFIGSSKEFIKIAKQIETRLRNELDVNVTVWDDPSVFRLGQNTMDSILTLPHFYDYSLLILGPDDIVKSRKATQPAPRDNLTFELGFFLGSQGRKRSFAVVLERPNKSNSKKKPIKLPSDIAGEQYLPATLGARNTISETSLSTIIARIEVALKNQKNLSYLSPLPSTVLAVTYYKNFLYPICDKISKSDVISANNGIKLHPKTVGFTVTVAIPKSLNKASLSGQQLYKSKNKLESFTVENETRPFPFFITLGKTSKGIKFHDVPTTLRGCAEAIRLLMPNIGAVGKSQEQEIVEHREIENFAETLQHVIDTDPDGQHLRDHIKIKFW